MARLEAVAAGTSITAAIVAVDQTTKVAWPGVTNGDLATGAWGVSRWTSIATAALVLAALTFVMVRSRAPWWTVALVLGGSIGNLTDRIIYGAVRDFIPAGSHWRWNLADAAFYIGLAAWLAILVSRSIRKRGKEVQTHDQEACRPTRTGGSRRHRRVGGDGAQVPALMQSRSMGRGMPAANRGNGIEASPDPSFTEGGDHA
jgi:hypothetical protein